MASVLYGMANTIGNGSATASGTSFFALGCGGGIHTPPTTEIWTQLMMRTAGNFTDLAVYVKTARATNSTVTFRVATADGTQTFTVTASTVGWFKDTTHTDAVVSGNLISMKWVNGTGSTALAVTAITATFSGGAAMYVYVPLANDIRFSTASVDRFVPITGMGGSTAGFYTTETIGAKVLLRSEGVISRLQCHVRNARAQASTLTYRDNAADGTNTITLTGATTGFFEDTTHSDTVTSGNTGGYKFTTGTGTDNHDLQFIACQFVPDGASQDCITGGYVPDATSDSTTVTNYIPVFGGTRSNTTEDNAECVADLTMTFTRMRVGIGTSATAGDETATFRFNGGDGTQTFTITAGTDNTVFEDTTHTDNVAAAETFNYSLTPVSAAAAQDHRWWAVLMSSGLPITADIGQTWGGWSQEAQGVLANTPGVIVQTWGGWSQRLTGFTPNTRDNRAVFGAGI